MNGRRGHQRGVALLVALLAVALALVLIAGLLDRGELALARTRNALRAEQASAYADGLEAFAAEVLFKAQAQQGRDPDSHLSPWALPLPPQPVPGGIISAQLSDLNGCFNINNLQVSQANPYAATWAARFGNLLNVLQLDPGLAQSVGDWLNTDTAGSSADNYYLAQPVPYRPAHRVFAHISELRLVRGVSGAVYGRLAPWVCALPPGTSLNVNTASVPVLMSLAPAMTKAQAERLWQNGRARWLSRADFESSLRSQGVVLADARGLDVYSAWFLVRGDIALDGIPFTFYSLLDAQRGGRNGGVHVDARSRGSDAALTLPADVTTTKTPL